MMKKRPSILFVDNDELYCSVLSSILLKRSIDTVGIVGNDLAEVSKVLSNRLPSIVAVCYKTTRPESINTVLWIRQNYPSINVVVLSQYNSPSVISVCKAAGVTNVIIKSEFSPLKIWGVLCAAHSGKQHFSKSTVSHEAGTKQ